MVYGRNLEDKRLFGNAPIQNGDDSRAKHVFDAALSAGANNEQLARILVALNFAFSVLGGEWETEGEKFIKFLTNYQASVDARYHDDYKSVATIEELDRRIAMRKSQSLMSPAVLSEPPK